MRIVIDDKFIAYREVGSFFGEKGLIQLELTLDDFKEATGQDKLDEIAEEAGVPFYFSVNKFAGFLIHCRSFFGIFKVCIVFTGISRNIVGSIKLSDI